MKNTCLCLKALLLAPMLFTSIIFPMQAYSVVCPNDVRSFPVTAVYVKYKVHDETQIRINQKAGFPNVVGDEFRELYLNEEFRKERLYGRLIADDMKNFNKHLAIVTEKGNQIDQRQERGEDVPLEEIEKISQEFIDNAYKIEVREYDRINISTPEYTGRFNKVSQKGYGFYRDINTQNQLLQSEIKSSSKTWILSQADLINQKFGFKRSRTEVRKILSYECSHKIINTKSQGWYRELGIMEVCTTKINGLDVVLAAAMGEQGNRYSIKAVEISPKLSVNREKYCLPDYVNMK